MMRLHGGVAQADERMGQQLGDSAKVLDLVHDPRCRRGPMNIAYLDPPYSRYFHELAARLAQRTSGKVLALLSSPAYAMYAQGDPQSVWQPGAVVDPPPIPPGLEHALWSQQVDEAFRAVFWHAVQWFRDSFRMHGVRLCLIFSDARPFSLAAAVAARDSGVLCLYFERGAYRLRTASLSAQGLNARFSLGRARAQTEVAGIAADAVLPLRRQEPRLRLNFLRFIVANEAACRIEPARRLLQHKRFALLPYMRLAMAQWWARRPISRYADARLGLAAASEVVLIPMQLPGDSQWRLHSPFADNQEFLDFVVQQVRRVAPEACVLVKRHPMDSVRYRMPEGAAAVVGNLTRFYRWHPVVVCINSTVGFEAAARGLQVVCFGDSFYTESAVVRRATRSSFADILAACLGSSADRALGRALLADVLRWYQAPGDTWGYSADDLERTADIVLQHYRASVAPTRSSEPRSESAPAGRTVAQLLKPAQQAGRP